MKNIIVIVLLILALNVSAQEGKRVNASIKEVTVFLSKAQINRKATVPVISGNSEIVITGLSPFLDPNSIQVSGKGNIIIKGVKHQTNYLKETDLPKHLKVISDSVRFYTDQLTTQKSLIDILNREEKLLEANQAVGSNQRNTTVAEVKAMADFFRSRLTDIASKKHKSQNALVHINARIKALNNQLNEERRRWNRNTSEIIVSVSARERTSAKLEVSYIVNRAGWNPTYDIRAINTKSDIELNYKANVFQNTGVDWNNCKLILSTANPNESGTKPELSPWYLNFYQPRVVQGRQNYKKYRTLSKSKEAAPQLADASSSYAEEIVEEDFESTADYTQVIQTSLNTQFEIALKYNIPTGNKPELVDIQNHTLKADYQYAAAPKLDRDAFLQAIITGWEGLSLLPGQSNVYFEGTFVSKAYINPNNTNDTLRLSLGRDKRVVIKREQLKDFTKTQSVGGKNTKSYAYEVSLRNTKAETISISLEEQIPISGNKDIVVELLDKGGASYSQSNGKLKWVISLKPNETRKLVYKFEVKHPKDRQVSGL